MTKKGEITIVLGDWNAKIGKGQYEWAVGKFGLGERNDRGERLLQFLLNKIYSLLTNFLTCPTVSYTSGYYLMV